MRDVEDKMAAKAKEAIFDVVVIGGGLAGLSLAVRFCEPAFAHLRVLVLESRSTYTRDKTWCRWRTSCSPFDAAVTHRWKKWAVGDLDGVHICESSQYPYEMIPADKLYDTALARISSSSNVMLWNRIAVQGLVLHRDFVEILLPAEKICGRLIFDGHPRRRCSDAGLIQRFTGFEIETDRDCFDPSTVTLMDFALPEGDQPAVHFIYLLPLSPRKALIEETWFLPPNDCTKTPCQSDGNISSYLARRFGVTEYVVLYRESGELAMDSSAIDTSGSHRVIPIGATANMSRASTGYAFDEIQRGCDQLMESIFSAGLGSAPRWLSLRPSSLISCVTKWMDHVFLKVLRHQPAMASTIFLRMFRETNSDALVRFLSGVGDWHDSLRVIAACPKLPFIRAAFRSS